MITNKTKKIVSCIAIVLLLFWCFEYPHLCENERGNLDLQGSVIQVGMERSRAIENAQNTLNAYGYGTGRSKYTTDYDSDLREYSDIRAEIAKVDMRRDIVVALCVLGIIALSVYVYRLNKLETGTEKKEL